MTKASTLERIEQDIAAGDYGKARDRLHGLLRTYPSDLSLRKRLGDVYWHLQYPAMAGRYWYLEEYKTPDMICACTVFERTYSNDAVHMLHALKYRGSLDVINGSFAAQTLLDLQKRAEQEHQYTFIFRKGSAAEQTASAIEGSSVVKESSMAGEYISIAVVFLVLASIPVGFYVILRTVWRFLFG